MLIGIVDADLLGRENHRFPNLACEKISGYWKEQGAEVSLIQDYYDLLLNNYDQVFVSKVFTDTPVPYWLEPSETVHIGGTGFFFDKAPNLPDYIEHHMPDYHLYDDWIQSEIDKAEKQALSENKEFNKKRFLIQFKEYTDYSIGFLTRGCFRKCAFCVNQKYDHVFVHSPLAEFFDPERKKICLLDDNVLGCSKWKELFETLIQTDRPFKFKQGLDERLLTPEKCEYLFNSKYDGDFTFAFDNIKDYDLIHSKLELIRQYSKARIVKFYVLVGFESIDIIDIENMFKRIELLMQYHCLPYIMRYQDKNYSPWKHSEFSGLYTAVARWCNQPSMFKKKSFRQFCEIDQETRKNTICPSMKALLHFEKQYPDIAQRYVNLNYADYTA